MRNVGLVEIYASSVDFALGTVHGLERLTKRIDMLRTTLIAASVLPATLLAAAEVPTITPIQSVVTGVAANDYLNIRATASPVGVVKGRMTNGAVLKNYGCDDFHGYRWCKVEAVEEPGVSGWTPERYLVAAQPGETAAEIDASPVEGVAPTQAGADDDKVDGAGNESNDSGPETVAAVGPAADTQQGDEATTEPKGPRNAKDDAPETSPLPPALPVDLMARFGGQVDQPLDPIAQRASPSIGQTAAEDAYGLAFAAQENPITGEIGRPPPEVSEAPADEEVPADEEAPTEDAAAPTVEAVPVPTPRPELEAASPDAAAAPEAVAVTQAQTPTTASLAYDATGQIPCARYIGQPMTPCEANVVRSGPDSADVRVSLPDGGTRTIHFKAGKPEGSGSRGEFRFTREGDLNMIRIGISERFEIPDSLAFGQ